MFKTANFDPLVWVILDERPRVSSMELPLQDKRELWSMLFVLLAPLPDEARVHLLTGARAPLPEELPLLRTEYNADMLREVLLRFPTSDTSIVF